MLLYDAENDEVMLCKSRIVACTLLFVKVAACRKRMWRDCTVLSFLRDMLPEKAVKRSEASRGHRRSGDQSGSEASSGVGRVRRLKPATSID